MTPREGHFSGSLIGQCLGDALGFRVEGHPPAICRQYVDEVLRAGKVPRPFGQYSDDSQLARELIESLVACGDLHPPDYARRIAAIFVEDRIVGRGRATTEAARRLAEGVPWNEAGTPPPAAGNGSAMRAGPIGLFFFADDQRMVQAAHDQGRITHRDRRCSAGAVCIAGAVALALRQVEPATYASTLSEWARPFDPVMARALERMPEWVQLPPETAVTQISTVGLTALDWEGISPFVTSSVLWSVYSFLRTPDDYWEAICTAIAVGGDVDTTAAMTGAISGARIGLDGIPSHLAKHLNDRGTWTYDDLVALALRCHATRSGP